MTEEIFFIEDDYSSFLTNDFIEINDNELESKVEITTEPIDARRNPLIIAETILKL